MSVFKKKHYKFRFHKEKQRINSHCDQIEKDIKRTVAPSCLNEKQRKSFFSAIRSVLVAYANFDKQIGYTQGMNIIVACILYNISQSDFNKLDKQEEHCFWLFTVLLEQYNIRACFLNEMKKIFDLSNSLDKLLKTRLRSVYRAINSDNVI